MLTTKYLSQVYNFRYTVILLDQGVKGNYIIEPPTFFFFEALYFYHNKKNYFSSL